MIYFNRQAAGKQLAKALAQYKGSDTVVLALPRGGVVLASEVARELHAPLGLVLVRKLGHPSYAEYAIGAVAENDTPIYNSQEIAAIDDVWLKRAESSARHLIEQRRKLYYGEHFIPPDTTGKLVILVDDGIATGLTMRAAVQAVTKNRPKQLIVAVPVASQESVNDLEGLVDKVVVLDDPRGFLGAVGAHYREFKQVNNDEVRALLKEVNHDLQHSASSH
jgi:putative phosphoribosyl transferase